MESDEALYEKLRAGDLRAFDRLYERYERPVFGFVCSFIHDSVEAEDVLHESFLQLLRDPEGGRDLRSFRAWFYQIARNACLNRLRAQRRASRALEIAANSEESGLPSLHADQALEACEEAEALRHAVARLPEALAELYQMRAAGLSYEELSDVLSIPLGTVKSRLHEMIRRLREEMHK